MNETDTVRAVSRMTYDTAERAYREGVLSQDMWEAYVHVWETSAFRFSVTVPSPAPTIPEVVRLVTLLRAQI